MNLIISAHVYLVNDFFQADFFTPSPLASRRVTIIIDRMVIVEVKLVMTTSRRKGLILFAENLSILGYLLHNLLAGHPISKDFDSYFSLRSDHLYFAILFHIFPLASIAYCLIIIKLQFLPTPAHPAGHLSRISYN